MDQIEREHQIRRFVAEVWNGQNYEATGDLYSEDYANPTARARQGRRPGSGRTTCRSPTCASTSTS